MKKKRKSRKKTTSTITVVLIIFAMIGALIAIGVGISNGKEKRETEKLEKLAAERTKLIVEHYMKKGDVDLGIYEYKVTEDSIQTAIVHIVLRPGQEKSTANLSSYFGSLSYIPIIETTDILGTASSIIAGKQTNYSPFVDNVLKSLYPDPNSKWPTRYGILTKIGNNRDVNYKYKCMGDSLDAIIIVSDETKPLESSYVYLKLNNTSFSIPW